MPAATPPSTRETISIVMSVDQAAAMEVGMAREVPISSIM